MREGYVKLWRKSIDEAVFRDPDLWRLFTFCLMRANHKPREYYQKGMPEPIIIKEGQFVTGRYELHESLYPKRRKRKKSTPSAITVWRWLLKLKKLANVITETNNRFSIVTICNWDIYQMDNNKNEHQNDQPVISRRSADDQPMITYKNVKNVKNVKKENIGAHSEKNKFGEFGNVKLTESEHKKLIEIYGESITKDFISQLDEYIGSRKGGDKYKDHYITIRNWIRRSGIKPHPEDVQKKNNKPSIDFSKLNISPKLISWFNKSFLPPIKERINDQSYKAFFEPLYPLKIENNTLFIYCPEDCVNWVQDNYGLLMKSVLQALYNKAKDGDREKLPLKYEFVTEIERL